jgi:hypothetical protein
MKSFKEYLTESKRVYEFKVKIVKELPKDCAKQLKEALSEYDPANVSAGKSAPISKHYHDFPDHKNVSMTVFDVTLNYPANPQQVKNAVAARLGIHESEIKVITAYQDLEMELNNQHSEKSGKSLLGDDYESSNNQDLVGEKHNLNFLKGLATSRSLEEVEGINDQLFVKQPTGKKLDVQPTVADKSGMVSPVGSRQNKLTPYANSVKNSLHTAAKGK